MFGNLVGNTKFQQLRQSEDYESSGILSPNDGQGRPTSRQFPNVLIILSLVGIFLLSAALGALLGMKVFVDQNSDCFARSSQFCEFPFQFLYCQLIDPKAPLLGDISLSYYLTTFNGSFMQESIYRKAASPEVDKAWQALGVDCALLLFQPVRII
jgi:Mycotoxin biosynthesis protein UstYa